MNNFKKRFETKQRYWIRGWLTKRREIEIFLTDLENARLESEYGETEEKAEEGIGIGKYPQDYFEGIRELETFEKEKEPEYHLNEIKHFSPA